MAFTGMGKIDKRPMDTTDCGWVQNPFLQTASSTQNSKPDTYGQATTSDMFRRNTKDAQQRSDHQSSQLTESIHLNTFCCSRK